MDTDAQGQGGLLVPPLIVSHWGNLYTASGLPLYRFVPLAQEVQQGQGVPWAAEWPPYIQAWVLHYWPLPTARSEARDIGSQLTSQPRDGAAPDRAYPQAVYRGWPLYTFGFDAPGVDEEPKGIVPGLFELVSVEEPPVGVGTQGSAAQAGDTGTGGPAEGGSGGEPEPTPPVGGDPPGFNRGP